MMRARFARRSLAICAVVLGTAVFALPGYAQTGQVKGKVVDAKNQPIEGAIITIEMIEGMTHKYQTKTNRRGEFVQIGLQPGNYRITASKDDMSQSFEQRIRLEMSEVNFVLKPGSQADISDEERKKAEAMIAAITNTFQEGVVLSNEGKHDEAIAKFNAVIAEAPKCVECYTNIGSVKIAQRDYEGAEAAFQEALKINPESAEAYNGLATVYNAQKKFKEAQAMSAEAAKRGPAGGEGGNANTLYNQGVIAWNAGDFAQAGEHFDAAVKADPNHGDARFMLGRTYLNLGKLAEAAEEFQTYLKVAPDGPHAKEAAANVEALKPYIKK